MGRTLLVSHRLPFSVSVKGEDYTMESSVGGLATGLMPLLADNNLWLGWSGTSQKLAGGLDAAIRSDFQNHGCVPIEFPEDVHHTFLTEMCNGILWPLFHYQIGNLPLQFSGWDDYVTINQTVADAIALNSKPGDMVWIHDYHFLLVPEMIREKNIDVKIGFFLHIPFPSYEVFRILPWRKEILKGLLGADLIGFHTADYVEHFIETARQLLNVEATTHTISLIDRQVQIQEYPLGVDPCELGKAYDGDSTLADALHKVRGAQPELKLFLSVDRLDYTKGLARKLLAFEYLLDHNPELRGKIMLIQIAPPSRGDVPAYHHFRRQLDEHVGRINGKYSTPEYQAIFYLTRSFHPQEIYQIYKDVDVMLVTPVRDGMNLVAKEFIAARDDEDGVLVLSEFAGAASELHEALMINPYDINQMANSLKTAVEMPQEERNARMHSLRSRVTSFRTSEWAENFLGQLRSTPSPLHKQKFESPRRLAAEISNQPGPLKITLDYDGTLFPIVRVPATAIPDQELRKILGDLSKLCDLHVVSGRPMPELKNWFAGLNIRLHAEHGAISEDDGARITPQQAASLESLSQALARIADKYPGARVEKKIFSSCFHYRACNSHDGAEASDEVRNLVGRDFPQLEVMDGKKAVEARFPDLNKGIVIKDLLSLDGDACVVAIGDDRTDEDMFAAVPEHGFSVVVGGHPSGASYRLRDSEDVRQLLSELTKLLKNAGIAKNNSPLNKSLHQSRKRERNIDFLSV